jgi:hypothetical protein
MSDAEAVITEYWFDHYILDGLCSLCGNSGVVDTTSTAKSPTGKSCGRKNWCICPNGQNLREIARVGGAR